jgi:hypothetical protein
VSRAAAAVVSAYWRVVSTACFGCWCWLFGCWLFGVSRGYEAKVCEKQQCTTATHHNDNISAALSLALCAVSITVPTSAERTSPTVLAAVLPRSMAASTAPAVPSAIERSRCFGVLFVVWGEE